MHFLYALTIRLPPTILAPSPFFEPGLGLMILLSRLIHRSTLLMIAVPCEAERTGVTSRALPVPSGKPQKGLWIDVESL